MTKRLSIASALLVALSALLALMLVTTPALAGQDEHGKADKGKGQQTKSETSDHDGDADSDSNTSKTEANDGDADDATDPNADEGDNAHPSGKDRSVENGGSGNQGNSESEPDDDGRGPERDYNGTDKPGGPGGVDTSDQDGNNGCGNDDDFEDDNEGWCGKPPETTTTTPPVVSGDEVKTCPSASTMGGSVKECLPPDTVLGDELENKDCPDEAMAGTVEADKDCDVVLGDVITNTDEPADDVAAAAATRPASSGAVLPFTGTSIVVFLVIALGLLGVGAALLRTRRS